jgi:hypothetical protein
MFVGPFVYLDQARLAHKGLLADRCPLEMAVLDAHRQVNPLTPEQLLGRIAPAEDPLHFPRGQVVFDLDSRLAVVYIDRCLEKDIDQIVRLFELPEWVVEYDERYVCPRCSLLADRF